MGLIGMGSVTPEKAIEFARLSVALTFCWPLSPKTTESQLIRFKIFRSILLLNAFVLSLPLAYSLYIFRDDFVNFSKSIWIFLAIVQILMNTSVCISQYDRLQELIEEMKRCCKNAKYSERCIYQKYVDEYSSFYGGSAIFFYATALIVATGTLFISQPFPTTAEYPFSVNYEPLRSIIFLHQTVVALQCSAQVTMSVFYALLLFFAAARFEILKMNLGEVKNSRELVNCLEKYYAVRRYATEVISATHFVALFTVILCGLVLVFSGINFIGYQPLTVKVQFLTVVWTGLIEVFMYAWPADHLLDLSQNAMNGVYESTWYEQSTDMQKDMLITLLPQAPVRMKVTYIIPTLSLSYYCSFVTNVMSFFTLLRATMSEDV